MKSSYFEEEKFSFPVLQNSINSISPSLILDEYTCCCT